MHVWHEYRSVCRPPCSAREGSKCYSTVLCVVIEVTVSKYFLLSLSAKRLHSKSVDERDNRLSRFPLDLVEDKLV